MIDDQVIGIETLEFGVRLRVLQEVEQKLCGFLGPTTLSCAMDLSLKEGTVSIRLLFLQMLQSRKGAY